MPKTYEIDLGDYWRIIKRRKLIILLTFVTITTAVWLHALNIPPTYEVSGSIKIERTHTTFTADPTRESWSYEIGDFLQTQIEIISSESIAYEAAKIAGLIKEGMTQEQIDEVTAQFMGVSAVQSGNTSIVDLSLQSSDPKKAAFVLNKVAEGYRAWSLQDHNEQAKQLREYVGNLLLETKKKLDEKGEELKKFKEDTPIGASLGGFQSQLVDMEIRLTNLLEKYTPKHPEIIELNSQIESLKTKLAKFPGLELKHNDLNKDYTDLQGSYGGLKQKYDDAKIAEAQALSGVTILGSAIPPTNPISPDVKKNTSVGALIALILGILLAFVKENVDTSIATIEDVEEFLQVPILGVIPEMVQHTPEQKWDWKQWLQFLPFRAFLHAGGRDVTTIEDIRKLIMLSGEEHQFSSMEAYKTLRTNILFSLGEKKGQIIEITSSGAREGKSITSLNLALTLAQNGQKTLLVSADLRRETICRILGIAKEPGLVEVLTKDIPWQDAIRKTTDLLVGELPPDRILQTIGIDNFYIFPSGKLPPNPAELLSLDKMKNLLVELRQNFDIVIIDTPPTLPVSDSSILAPHVDGVMLVYQVGRTARGALKRTKIQIASTGAKILGVLLNNIKAAEMKMAPTYYYYREYYGPDEQLIRERKQKRDRHKSWWQKIFSKAA